MNTLCFFLMLVVSIHCLKLQLPQAFEKLHHMDQLTLKSHRISSQFRNEKGSVSSLADNTCATIGCVGLGQPCNSTGNPLYLCDPTSQVCIGNVNASTCVPQVPAGGVCDPNLNECVENYACINGVCVLEPYISPGFACTSNGQCVWVDDDYNLLNSTCVKGLCYSYANGQICANTIQCNALSVCNSSQICSPLLTQGSACDISNDLCGGITVCYSSNPNATQGICTQVFTVPVGGYCSSSTVCKEGLYCSSLSSQCLAPPPLTYNNCSSDTDCPDYEYCTCNYYKGYSTCQSDGTIIPIGATAIYNAYWSCFERYLCLDDPCYYKNCKSAYCQLLNAAGIIASYAQTPLCALSADEVLEVQTCSPSTSTSPAVSAFAAYQIAHSSFFILSCLILLLI